MPNDTTPPPFYHGPNGWHIFALRGNHLLKGPHFFLNGSPIWPTHNPPYFLPFPPHPLPPPHTPLPQPLIHPPPPLRCPALHPHPSPHPQHLSQMP